MGAIFVCFNMPGTVPSSKHFLQNILSGSLSVEAHFLKRIAGNQTSPGAAFSDSSDMACFTSLESKVTSLSPLLLSENILCASERGSIGVLNTELY